MLTNKVPILRANGIEKSFQLRKVLNHVDFEIRNGDRIGLVGYNGAGKTTLANILFGKIPPDQGTIEVSTGVKIGYLSQSVDYEVNDFQQSLTSKNHQLFQHARELGLHKVSDWEEERLTYLSGGEKLKLALSMVWSSKPDFLILDEPTNHLDFKGIEWLISELQNFQGPVLVISHDRHFLDQTVKQIFEIEHGKLNVFTGNYSSYREKKKQQVESQHHHYHVQQRQIKLIEEQMEQLKSWSDKAHKSSTKQGRDYGYKEYHRAKAKKRDNQVKSKMKRLQNELEKNKVEKPIEEGSVRFEFDNQGKRGKRIIEAKNLSKQFGQRTLFGDSQFYINYGDRIGLLGENGCGKSTLIKMILDKESCSDGELWRSQSLKIAYLSQDVDDLPSNKTALDALGLDDRESIFKARTMLANLGLKETLITKPLGTLSLGERTRVKLVDILMKEYDVLLLDEPTNHLDLPSREQLESTLKEFSGTIITVSHDFYFLNKLCDKLLVFEDQRVKRVEMTPVDYLNKTLNKKDNREEELLIIENNIVSILGELSIIERRDPRYEVLDNEFNELIRKKRELNGN